MGGADGDLAGDEDSDLHEGRTGVQSSSASTVSDERTQATTAATASAANTSGENRFTTAHCIATVGEDKDGSRRCTG
jgi:hypothetical protein